MPELPEVENIRRQLEPLRGSRILQTITSPLRLRYALSPSDITSLTACVIAPQGPLRAGRYVLLPVNGLGMLMIHLGMTGALRLESAPIARKHDHIALHVEAPDGSRRWLVYNDPRRFGGLALLPAKNLAQARQILRLGREPTEPIAPDSLAELYDRLRPIKPLLMDNQLVTGIGNIYASEICHSARISPHRQGCTLAPDEIRRLALAIFEIISHAIEQGGSTFRNYSHVDGSQGSAQDSHRVYGRTGGACSRCAHELTGSLQAGRATVHCPNCQL